MSWPGKELLCPKSEFKVSHLTPTPIYPPTWLARVSHKETLAAALHLLLFICCSSAGSLTIQSWSWQDLCHRISETGLELQARTISLLTVVGIKRKQIDLWWNLPGCPDSHVLPVLLPPYLSQATFPNEHSMQNLAAGLRKVTPSIPAGGREQLPTELETPHDSSHPCCPLCAVGKWLEKGRCIHGPLLQQSLKNIKKQSWTRLYITAVCVGMYLWHGWCAYVKWIQLYRTRSMKCHRLPPWTFHDGFSFTLKVQAAPLRLPHSWGPSQFNFQGDYFWFHIVPYIQEENKENDAQRSQKT